MNNLIKKLIPSVIRDNKRAIRFEYLTWKKRLFAKKTYSYPDLAYVQFGCGEHLFENFLNTDCFVNDNADLHIDCRFPIPLENNAWKGIYTHHFLEHIEYPHALNFYSESYRILKLGGVLRIVVPDAEKIIKLYASSDPADKQKVFEFYPPWHRHEEHKTAMEVVNYIFRDNMYNQHYFAFDFETLEYRLKEAGFSNVNLLGLNESADPMLANKDNETWENHSLYVEAIK